MNIETGHVPYIGVIAATGDSREESTDSLEKAMMQLLDEGTQKVVMDLSGISFLDSRCVGSVMSAGVAASQRSVELTLVLPKPTHESTLELLNHSVTPMPWRLAETREEAIEALASTRLTAEAIERANRRALFAFGLAVLALLLGAWLLLLG